MPPGALPVFTFLLIFGPRVLGTNVMDLLSWAAIVLAVYVFAEPGARSPSAPFGGSAMGILTIGLIYSLANIVVAPYPELFHPMRFARAMLNYAAVYALCGLYARRYGHDFVYRLLTHVFWCIAAHAVLMIAQYWHIEFGSLVYQISGTTRTKTTRVTGLTISYGVLSITQGIGLLLGIALRDRLMRGRGRWYYYPAMSAIAFSLTLAGRSGFYLTIASLLFAAAMRVRHLLSARLALRVVIVLALTIGVIAVAPATIRARLVALTLPHLFEPIIDYLQTGEIHVASIDHVMRMYFLPADDRALFLGNAISGRGAIYVPSDVGYVLHVFGLGIVGFLAIIAFYVYALAAYWQWRKYDWWVWFIATALTFEVLILHAKEQSLLTRHTFTLSAIFLTALYFLRDLSLRNRAARLEAPSGT